MLYPQKGRDVKHDLAIMKSGISATRDEQVLQGLVGAAAWAMLFLAVA